jgi:hypothetical protein
VFGTTTYLALFRSTVNKRSRTPPTFLPLTKEEGGGVRNEAVSRWAPSLRGIISLDFTSPLQKFTAYHFSNSPLSSRDVTPQNHPLQVPFHDPVSMSPPSNHYRSYLFHLFPNHHSSHRPGTHVRFPSPCPLTL